MQTIFVALTVAIFVALGNTQSLPEPGVCGVSAIQPKPPSRIINGEAAIPHSRPYQLLLVAFFPNGTAKFYCGASLIKPTHALTAAHCVDGNAPKDIRLFPGVHEFTSSLLTTSGGIPARQFYRHESYNNKSLANDIAVIRLQTPAVVDNVKVSLICLPPATAPACAVGTPVVGKYFSLVVDCFRRVFFSERLGLNVRRSQSKQLKPTGPPPTSWPSMRRCAECGLQTADLHPVLHSR
jgi:hypothetical protein